MAHGLQPLLVIILILRLMQSCARNEPLITDPAALRAISETSDAAGALADYTTSTARLWKLKTTKQLDIAVEQARRMANAAGTGARQQWDSARQSAAEAATSTSLAWDILTSGSHRASSTLSEAATRALLRYSEETTAPDSP